VINYANNSDRAQKVLDELHKIPRTGISAEQPRFAAIKADVGDRSELQRLVAETVDKFGRIDVVFVSL
jgi:NAD(P)-dependent dehydrogenase (short-subunit alcohol dehydrogenase family)